MSYPSAVDIVIPVFNEAENIRAVLDSFKQAPFSLRVLICYDFAEDNTLAALHDYDPYPLEMIFVRNRSGGALEAVLTGFSMSTAPYVIAYPADDDYNGARIVQLVRLAAEGHDIVSASRFMPGGTMDGCPWLKASLVRCASWFLYQVAGVPTRDATNGLRLFSRRVLNQITIESRTGFAYSIELLVKVHRLGWPITETPFLWQERRAGQSRFQILAWVPEYLRWLCYALATRFLRRGAKTVPLRSEAAAAVAATVRPLIE